MHADRPLLPGRFQTRRMLGRGATGVVWLVHDRELGIDVAVKTLSARTPAELRGLKREFRLLRDVRHDNLVQFYELLEIDRLLCLTMEVVEGCPLDARGERADYVSIASQLFAGLDALHSAGLVHGDVKPTNVMLGSSGRIVLLDFGFALAYEPSRRATAFTGTVSYAAPESLYRGRREPASDVFAAAATLVELITERRPDVPWGARQGDDIDLCARTEVAPELVAVLRDALRRDPAVRPSARDAAHRLGRASIATRVFSSTPNALQGRDAELVRVDRHLDSNAPIEIRVAGDAGIGKTAFMRHVVGRVRARGVGLLSSRCDPIESLPLQALDGVVDALAEDRRFDAAIAKLDASQRDAIARAFPAIGLEPPSDHSASSDIGPLSSALVELLRALAPTSIWIDDAHWGDDDSARILALALHAVRNDPAPPMLMLSYRSAGAFVERLGTYASSPLRVELHTLADADAIALARVHAPDLDAEAAASLARESAGSPFLIVHRARELHLDPIDADAAELLIDVGVCGGAVPAHVLVARKPDRNRARSLFALCRDGTLEPVRRANGSAISFAHDELRLRWLEGVDEQRFARAAVEIARAWESSESAEPIVLARLFQRGGDSRATARWALAAAHKAERALAFRQASDMYALAAEADASVRSAHLESWARCLSLAGESKAAADVCLGAAEAMSGRARERALAMAAGFLLAAGEIERGLTVVDAALLHLRLERPRGRSSAIVRFLGERTLLRLSRRTVARDPLEIERLDRACDTVFSLASVYGILDTLTGSIFQARMLRWARRLGPGPQLLRATASELVYAGVTGGRSSARRAAIERELTALETSVSDGEARAYATVCRGYEAFMCADFADASAFFDRGLELYGELGGFRWTRSLAQVHKLLADTWLDRLETVERQLPDLLDSLRSRDDRLNAALLELGAGYLVELAHDEPGRARDRLERAMHSWEGVRAPALEYLYYRGRSNIDLFVGTDAYASHRARLEPSLWALGAQANRIELAFFDAVGSGGDRRAIERSISRLRKERAVWGDALALVLSTHRAVLDGDEEGAREIAARALSALRAAGLLSYASVWSTVSVRRGWIEETSAPPRMPQRWERMLAPHWSEPTRRGRRWETTPTAS